ncbi:MAG: ATP-binding protein [Oligoflexia bacterium]|nr:ATP-binding protein [Oligoflexia bacterium]
MMRISRIVIDNYRSIQKAEVNLDKFSIFVGQNNHGKTNFFEAIEWFFNKKSSKRDEHFNRDERNQISVEIFFESVMETDIKKLKNEGNQTKI